MNNNKKHFVLCFASRLVDLLKEKGHASHRSESGVKVAEMAKAIGHSHQMTRRYALGTALPDYQTVLKLADWLDVSPGWLLFGEDPAAQKFDNKSKLICIDCDLLEYIISRSSQLMQNSHHYRDVVKFVMDVVYDASHLKVNRETILRIIDMSINSAERFQEKPSEKNDEETSMDRV